jgi:hypothetical protein
MNDSYREEVLLRAAKQVLIYFPVQDSNNVSQQLVLHSLTQAVKAYEATPEEGQEHE